MYLWHVFPVLTGLASITAAAAALAPTPTCTYAKATPTPSSSTCEVQGSLKRPSVLFTINPIPNLQGCYQRCIAESQCLSYGYSASSKTCTFYTKTLGAQGFTRGNTGVVFAARTCYSCQCAAGLSKCGQKCLNLQMDSSNCGKCGFTCTKGSTCQTGVCACSKPGALWQISPGYVYAGYYGAYIAGSAVQATNNRSAANVFTFEGTNVTTAVSDNVTAIVFARAEANPNNPPNYQNSDGTPAHLSPFFLTQEDQLNPEIGFPLSCRATPQRTLFCQNYNTLNKIQLCQPGVNNYPVFVIADTAINGTDIQCVPTSVDLVCP